MRFVFDGPEAICRLRNACPKDRHEYFPQYMESPLLQLLRALIARHLSWKCFSCLSAWQLYLAPTAESEVMIWGKECQAAKRLRQPVGGTAELHLAMHGY